MSPLMTIVCLIHSRQGLELVILLGFARCSHPSSSLRELSETNDFTCLYRCWDLLRLPLIAEQRFRHLLTLDSRSRHIYPAFDQTKATATSAQRTIMDQPVGDPNHSSYRGSHIFGFAAKFAGIQVDQFNFLLSELLAFIFAICFRRYLPPKPSNLIKRHLIGTRLLSRREAMISIFEHMLTCSACSSQSSRHCTRSILFRLTNLAFNPSIVHLLSDALLYSTEAFVQVRRRLLHGIHERE